MPKHTVEHSSTVGKTHVPDDKIAGPIIVTSNVVPRVLTGPDAEAATLGYGLTSQKAYNAMVALKPAAMTRAMRVSAIRDAMRPTT